MLAYPLERGPNLRTLRFGLSAVLSITRMTKLDSMAQAFGEPEEFHETLANGGANRDISANYSYTPPPRIPVTPAMPEKT